MCPFELGKTSGDIGRRCMPNSGPGGCPGIQIVTIFGSYLGPHFPNIVDFAIYGNIYIYVHGRYLTYMKVYEGI